MPLDCRLLQVQREAWATDLDLPAFVVRAEQDSEVSITGARSAACAVTRQMPLDSCLLQGQVRCRPPMVLRVAPEGGRMRRVLSLLV